MDSKDIEILERLTRLEVKIDNYNSDIAMCVNLATENKNEIAVLKNTVGNQAQAIDELKNRNTWLSRTSIGAVISSIGAVIVMFIRIAIGG